jgi:hypothetical protein
MTADVEAGCGSGLWKRAVEAGSIVGQWGLPGVSLSGRDAQARVLKVGCNLLSAKHITF